MHAMSKGQGYEKSCRNGLFAARYNAKNNWTIGASQVQIIAFVDCETQTEYTKL